VPAHPLSDAVLRATYDLVLAHNGNITRAADASGLASRATFETRWRRAASWARRQGLPLPTTGRLAPQAGAPLAPLPRRPTSRYTESTTVKGDTAEVTKTTHERVRTLADLIRVCAIDVEEWEVERWIANKWEMGSTDADGDPQTTDLYQIKAWLRRRVALVAARAEIEALKKLALVAFPARPKRQTVTQATASGYLLELSIPDLHVGKLAWSRETGHDDYDHKIARRLHDEAVETLIARTASYRFEEVVLVVGHDLLHCDSKAGTTTRGTPLDMDTRFHKVFGVVRTMIVAAIERCRTIAPKVRVVMVPGNHDTLSVWHLGDSLECFYHATPDVEIDNAPTARKYVEWGLVMLLMCHGDKGKLDKLPLLMATERPDLFGRTRYREAHTGHLHQLRVQEHHGVRVRISPALAAADAWHADNAYVGQQRAAEAFVWSKSEGLVGTAVYTVPEVQDDAA
jgi:hypothetical protein